MAQKKGQKIEIYRLALGTFWLTAAGQRQDLFLKRYTPALNGKERVNAEWGIHFFPLWRAASWKFALYVKKEWENTQWKILFKNCLIEGKSSNAAAYWVAASTQHYPIYTRAHQCCCMGRKERRGEISCEVCLDVIPMRARVCNQRAERSTGCKNQRETFHA